MALRGPSGLNARKATVICLPRIVVDVMKAPDVMKARRAGIFSEILVGARGPRDRRVDHVLLQQLVRGRFVTRMVPSITWKMKFVCEGASWKVSGSDDDAEGASVLTGKCDDSKCDFRQVYKNGSSKGATFDWTGTHVDKELSQSKVENTFDGTWKSEDGSKGKWNAKGMCDVK